MRTLIAVGIDTREVDLIFSRLEEKGSRDQALKKSAESHCPPGAGATGTESAGNVCS